MQLRRYALAFAMVLIASAPSAFAQARRLSLEMRPAASVTDAQIGQVIVTVDGGALTNATLALELRRPACVKRGAGLSREFSLLLPASRRLTSPRSAT